MATRELRPTGRRWESVPVPHEIYETGLVLSASAWRRGGFSVISALEVAKYPDSPEVGPQWHISISHLGGRASVVSGVLRAFKVPTAEEDNHHPGKARHFWFPVDPAHRSDCECKEDEQTIVEPDGYRWTNPKTGKCRGCEWRSFSGNDCPIHGAFGGWVL